MSNKRENDLWKEMDTMIFIVALLGISLLIGAYFVIANLGTVINVVLQEFLLSIILNIIPAFLLFIGAYLVFRRIEKLRSEKDADELATKVVLRLTEIARIQTATSSENNNLLQPSKEFSEKEFKLYRQFEITNKFFDSKSKPQKLVIEFTNRGNNIVQIRKVSYTNVILGLPKEAISKAYRLDTNDHSLLINQNVSEILPEAQYTVEVRLDGKWEDNAINRYSGKWGYLSIELVCANEAMILHCPI